MSELTDERGSRKRKNYKTIDGSSVWHVIVFKPNQEYFVASNCFCICDQCSRDYGTCALFSKYQLDVSESLDIPLRSDDNIPFETVGQEKDEGIIGPNTNLALCANDSIDHSDTTWMVKVTLINQLNNMKTEEDSYHNIIPKGNVFFWTFP